MNWFLKKKRVYILGRCVETEDIFGTASHRRHLLPLQLLTHPNHSEHHNHSDIPLLHRNGRGGRDSGQLST